MSFAGIKTPSTNSSPLDLMSPLSHNQQITNLSPSNEDISNYCASLLYSVSIDEMSFSVITNHQFQFQIFQDITIIISSLLWESDRILPEDDSICHLALLHDLEYYGRMPQETIEKNILALNSLSDSLRLDLAESFVTKHLKYLVDARVTEHERFCYLLTMCGCIHRLGMHKLLDDILGHLRKVKLPGTLPASLADFEYMLVKRRMSVLFNMIFSQDAPIQPLLSEYTGNLFQFKHTNNYITFSQDIFFCLEYMTKRIESVQLMEFWNEISEELPALGDIKYCYPVDLAHSSIPQWAWELSFKSNQTAVNAAKVVFLTVVHYANPQCALRETIMASLYHLRNAEDLFKMTWCRQLLELSLSKGLDDKEKSEILNLLDRQVQANISAIQWAELLVSTQQPQLVKISHKVFQDCLCDAPHLLEKAVGFFLPTHPTLAISLFTEKTADQILGEETLFPLLTSYVSHPEGYCSKALGYFFQLIRRDFCANPKVVVKLLDYQKAFSSTKAAKKFEDTMMEAWNHRDLFENEVQFKVWKFLILKAWDRNNTIYTFFLWQSGIALFGSEAGKDSDLLHLSYALLIKLQSRTEPFYVRASFALLQNSSSYVEIPDQAIEKKEVYIRLLKNFLSADLENRDWECAATKVQRLCQIGGLTIPELLRTFRLIIKAAKKYENAEVELAALQSLLLSPSVVILLRSSPQNMFLLFESAVELAERHFQDDIKTYYNQTVITQLLAEISGPDAHVYSNYFRGLSQQYLPGNYDGLLKWCFSREEKTLFLRVIGALTLKTRFLSSEVLIEVQNFLGLAIKRNELSLEFIQNIHDLFAGLQLHRPDQLNYSIILDFIEGSLNCQNFPDAIRDEWIDHLLHISLKKFRPQNSRQLERISLFLAVHKLEIAVQWVSKYLAILDPAVKPGLYLAIAKGALAIKKFGVALDYLEQCYQINRNGLLDPQDLNKLLVEMVTEIKEAYNKKRDQNSLSVLVKLMTLQTVTSRIKGKDRIVILICIVQDTRNDVEREWAVNQLLSLLSTHSFNIADENINSSVKNCILKIELTELSSKSALLLISHYNLLLSYFKADISELELFYQKYAAMIALYVNHGSTDSKDLLKLRSILVKFKGDFAVETIKAILAAVSAGNSLEQVKLSFWLLTILIQAAREADCSEVVLAHIWSNFEKYCTKDHMPDLKEPIRKLCHAASSFPACHNVFHGLAKTIGASKSRHVQAYLDIILDHWIKMVRGTNDIDKLYDRSIDFCECLKYLLPLLKAQKGELLHPQVENLLTHLDVVYTMLEPMVEEFCDTILCPLIEEMSVKLDEILKIRASDSVLADKIRNQIFHLAPQLLKFIDFIAIESNTLIKYYHILFEQAAWNKSPDFVVIQMQLIILSIQDLTTDVNKLTCYIALLQAILEFSMIQKNSDVRKGLFSYTEAVLISLRKRYEPAKHRALYGDESEDIITQFVDADIRLLKILYDTYCRHASEAEEIYKVAKKLQGIFVEYQLISDIEIPKVPATVIEGIKEISNPLTAELLDAASKSLEQKVNQSPAKTVRLSVEAQQKLISQIENNVTNPSQLIKLYKLLLDNMFTSSELEIDQLDSFLRFLNCHKKKIKIVPKESVELATTYLLKIILKALIWSKDLYEKDVTDTYKRNGNKKLFTKCLQTVREELNLLFTPNYYIRDVETVGCILNELFKANLIQWTSEINPIALKVKKHNFTISGEDTLSFPFIKLVGYYNYIKSVEPGNCAVLLTYLEYMVARLESVKSGHEGQLLVLKNDFKNLDEVIANLTAENQEDPQLLELVQRLKNLYSTRRKKC